MSPAGRAAIDELDRTDEPFEAFLLEVLSDFQVTIPELGTIKAAEPPIVIVTSNRTREIHRRAEAALASTLGRLSRCRARARHPAHPRRPGTPAALSAQIVAFVQKLRRMDLFKHRAWPRRWTGPGPTELDVLELDPDVVRDNASAPS